MCGCYKPVRVYTCSSTTRPRPFAERLHLFTITYEYNIHVQYQDSNVNIVMVKIVLSLCFIIMYRHHSKHCIYALNTLTTGGLVHPPLDTYMYIYTICIRWPVNQQHFYTGMHSSDELIMYVHCAWTGYLVFIQQSWEALWSRVFTALLIILLDGGLLATVKNWHPPAMEQCVCVCVCVGGGGREKGSSLKCSEYLASQTPLSRTSPWWEHVLPNTCDCVATNTYGML